MQLENSLFGRSRLVLNLSLIVLSIGLVAGVQALRDSGPAHSGSIVASVAVAGVDPSASPSPSPSPSAGCSPGYFKNHQSVWVGSCCDGADQRSCSDLLNALTCKGSDASCGRSAAAAYLNACTGCTEKD